MTEDEEVKEMTKHAFLNFMVEFYHKFSPKAARKIMYEDAVNFVDDWVEKNYQ